MLPDVQAGLDLLSRACSNQSLPIGERTLSISVAPSFASKWLLPRLPSFYHQHPDVELRISATVELADFRRDGIDLAIRLGHGRYAGLLAEPLFSEALTPLCSPKILKKREVENAEDLRKHRIIHDTSIPGQGEHSAWDKWLALAGAKHVSARRGARFTLAELAMQAAIDGQASCSDDWFWPKGILLRVDWSVRSNSHCLWMPAISWLNPRKLRPVPN